jgi:hypothetical protein
MGKTVFILGAGASKDFGGSMPVGTQLAQMITDELLFEIDREGGPEGPVVQTFREFKGGWSRELAREAIQIVKSITAKDSIDELLNEWAGDRPDMMKIGKCVIAYCLLEAESRTLLVSSLNEEMAWARQLQSLRTSWAGILFRKAGGPSLPRRRAYQAFSNIAFITFNYDRCLERFLLAQFIHVCGLTESEAFEALSTVEIIHAYGDLGDLKQANVPAQVPYGSSEPWSINYASERIRTFTEDFVTGHDATIQSVVSSAARLVFIGFGFHPRNLDLLFGTGQGAPDLPCFGTAPTKVLNPISQDRFTSARSAQWITEHSAQFMELHGDYALTF